MQKKTTPAKTVDEYLATFPAATKKILEQLRKVIKAAAPKAEEGISYQMPAYKYKGVLVYFAAYEKHIGFYAAPTGHAAFKKELSVYKTGKGSVQFPLDQPFPFDLVTKIVKWRVKENDGKAAGDKKEKSAAKPAASKKPSDEEQVKAWMAKLEPAAKKEIEAVRKIIKGASPKLSERIKWNAPSYYYKEDIVTFGPYKTHKLLLVFHHPAVVKIKSALLEGDYKDRRLVYFDGLKAVKDNAKELERILTELVKAIDKK